MCARTALAIAGRGKEAIKRAQDRPFDKLRTGLEKPNAER